MATINLIEKIQQNLTLAPVQKIDPNTQEVKKPENMSVQDYLGQAAIPTVLLGLYKYSRSVEGNVEILNTPGANLLDTIYGEIKPQVVDRVANYTVNDAAYTREKMEAIAEEAVRLIRENITGKTTGEAVRAFLSDQRHNILVTLPAGLQLGELLHQDDIDDRTNKMEGPLSGHMHWLEKLFSASPPKATRGAAENW